MNSQSSRAGSTGRRSQLETICDILAAVDSGAYKPTRIMQRANIGWQLLTDSLEVLTRNGLLVQETSGQRRSYYLTSKGLFILAEYRQLTEAVGNLLAVQV